VKSVLALDESAQAPPPAQVFPVRSDKVTAPFFVLVAAFESPIANPEVYEIVCTELAPTALPETAYPEVVTEPDPI
jgi:hypothetical protein